MYLNVAKMMLYFIIIWLKGKRIRFKQRVNSIGSILRVHFGDNWPRYPLSSTDLVVDDKMTKMHPKQGILKIIFKIIVDELYSFRNGN